MLIDEEMRGASGKMKQFIAWFTHGVPNGTGLRKAVHDARTEQEILARVEDFFERQMSAPEQPSAESISAVEPHPSLACDLA